MSETLAERDSEAASLGEAEQPQSADPAPKNSAGGPRWDATRRRALATVFVVALLIAGTFHVAWPYLSGMNVSGPRTFYVAADGKDSNEGTSPKKAWHSLSQADHHVFQPGERLLLQGGASFSGSLTFHRGEAGDPAKPVIVGSYGSGRAAIVGSGDPGVSVYDTAGIDIRDLIVIGGGPSSGAASGIALFSDLPNGPKLEHVSVSDVDVSGFRVGVSVGGGVVGAGFRDVRVTDSLLHDNGDSGLRSYGPPFDAAEPRYANENLFISNVRAFANLGNALDHLHNTGSGIDLGSVRGAVVEHSVAYGNGANCDSREGPVGIWAYDSTGVVLQHNVAYDNHTGGLTDGGGFDLDQNVSDSVVQYNYSHDNDGPGYLLYTGKDNGAFARNVVRFNISRNDVRRPLNYASLVLAGRLTDISVYHNTVVLQGVGKQAPVVRFETGLQGVTLRDNIFESEGGRMIASSDTFSAKQVTLQGNDYYVPGRARWVVAWGTKSFGSLQAWSARTGQEMAGPQPVGLDLNPDLVLVPAPGWDPTGTPVPTPRATSPIAGRSPDLRTRFAVDEGLVDYFGTPLGAFTTAGAAQPVAVTG
ncbi:right-handed parallel beta-helix repeat-containing protein [Catenulispora subtropica]|uniref:Right handed beta helix domain-containing protein n=1 Tax=Catenulispora subtropica TaxID=450798 RepID=A0ABN2QCV5_9ACTN